MPQAVRHDRRIERCRDVPAHPFARRLRRREETAGCEQQIPFAPFGRERIGVGPRTDPCEQPVARPSEHVDAERSERRQRFRTRIVEPRTQRGDVAVVAALDEQRVHEPLVELGRREADQHLRIGERRGERCLARDEADAHVRRERLRKTARVDDAVEPVDRSEAHAGRRAEIGVRVVFEDRHAGARGDLDEASRGFFKMIENCGHTELARSRALKEVPNRVDGIVKNGRSLEPHIRDDFAKHGGRVAEDVQSEMTASFDALSDISKNARSGAREAEDFVADLQRAVGSSLPAPPKDDDEKPAKGKKGKGGGVEMPDMGTGGVPPLALPDAAAPLAEPR